MLLLVIVTGCRINFDEVVVDDGDGGLPPTGEVCTLQWCWDNVPAPALITLRAISGSSATNVWAAGDAGVIRRWNGVAWQYVTSPTRESISAIDVVSESDVMIAAGAGTVWHFDGSRWLSSMTPSGSTAAAFWRDPQTNRLWSAGDIGTVADGANPLPPVPGRQATMSFHGRTASNVWHAGAFNSVSHWDSANWSQSLLADFPYAVWAIGQTVEAYAGGQHIWRCGTGCVMDTANANVRGFFGFADDDVWAVGSSGSIRHFTGTSWESVAAPNAVHYLAAWGAAPNDVWAVGEFGAIVHWDGVAWTSMGTDLPQHAGWGAFWANTEDDQWLTTQGEMWRRTAGALERVALPSGAIVGDEIEGSAGDRVCAINGAGRVLCFDGSAWTDDTMSITTPAGLAVTPSEIIVSSMTTGEVWQKPIAGPWALGITSAGTELHGICVSDANDALVVGRFGRAATRSGGSWSITNSPTQRFLLACDFAGERAWAVGGDVALEYMTGTWLPSAPTATTHPLFDVLAVSPSEVYASAAEGHIMRFDGAKWHEEAVPVGFTVYKLSRTVSGTIFAVGSGGVILRRR